jgi:hypothetical protein
MWDSFGYDISEAYVMWRIDPLLGRASKQTMGRRPLLWDGAVNTPLQQESYATNVKWEVISHPFLGNGSVNTFPRQRLCMQRGKRGVVYAVRVEELQRKRNGAASSVELCKRDNRDGAITSCQLTELRVQVCTEDCEDRT